MSTSPDNWTTWIPSIITVVFGLLAGVFGYGKLNAKTEDLDKKFEDFKTIIMSHSKDISDIRESVGRIEGYLEGRNNGQRERRD